MPKQVKSIPEGWTMEIKTRKTGQKDRVIKDPVSGLVFRSFKEVDRFLKIGKVQKLSHKLRDKAQSNKSAASSKQKLAERRDEQPNQCKIQGTVMPCATMTTSTSLKWEPEALKTPLSSPKQLAGIKVGPVSESASPVEALIPQKLDDINLSGVSSIKTSVGPHGFPQEEGDASMTAELSLSDLFSFDPCIEFAVKVLTGECPIVVGKDENVDNNNITTNNCNADTTNTNTHTNKTTTTTSNNSNETPFSSLLQDMALGGFCAAYTGNQFPVVEDVGNELNAEEYLQQDIEGGLAQTNEGGEVAKGVDTCLSTDLLAQHFDDAKGDDGGVLLNPDNCVANEEAKEGEQQPGPSDI